MIVVGRTENCEEGIYVNYDCFAWEQRQKSGTFAFRQSRSRETAFSYDYKAIRSYGKIHLFLGGIGADGHIAFNEPYSS